MREMVPTAAVREAIVAKPRLLTCAVFTVAGTRTIRVWQRRNSRQDGRSAQQDVAPGAQAHKIVRVLPAEGGEYYYRIKSVFEPFVRIARQSELSALQA
jgi:hypothetical protein